jgi:hypothetical protein
MVQGQSALPGSLCNMLSWIYFHTDDPKIKLQCRIATTCAKAMSGKLKEYSES